MGEDDGGVIYSAFEGTKNPGDLLDLGDEGTGKLASDGIEMATVQLDSNLADVQLDIKDDEGGSQSTDDGAKYFFEQRRKKGVPQDYQEEEEDFTEEAKDLKS